MKHLLILALIGLNGLLVKADDQKLPPQVFVEMATHSGHVMPEYQGTTRFQLLSSGVVQTIDIKNNITVHAMLSSDVVTKLKANIELIKNEQLEEPTGPICADAPNSEMTVQKANGQNILIWENVNCNELLPLDKSALNISEIIKQLEDTFRLIKYLP